MKKQGNAMVQKWFTVRTGVTIGGNSFRPTICYALSPNLETTVSKLVQDGFAKIWDEKVVYVNGIPRTAKKNTPPPPQAPPPLSSTVGPAVVGVNHTEDEFEEDEFDEE